MYNPEKQRERVLTLYPEATIEKIDLQLEFAKDFINERRGFIPTDEIPMEDRWLSIQVLMTVEALAREGAEGEIMHTDNGVSRMYGGAGSYSDAIMNKVIPLGGTLK